MKRFGLTVGAAMLAGLLGVALAGALIPHQEIYDESINAVERFPTNQSGQTYGLIDQGLKGDHSARAQLVAVSTDRRSSVSSPSTDRSALGGGKRRDPPRPPRTP